MSRVSALPRRDCELGVKGPRLPRIGDEGSSLYGAGAKGDKMLAAENLIAAGAKLKIISANAFLTMKGKAKA